MKKVKLAMILSLVVVLLFSLTACTQNEQNSNQTTTTTEPVETTLAAETTTVEQIDLSAVPKGQPIITISTQIGSRLLPDMVLALDPAEAPNTVANFVTLAKEGYYNGLIFHRIINGFMIQGGDPTGSGMGGPDYSIVGEFEANGHSNAISHQRGVISMARSQHPDSAGSQFFICHQDASFLDGEYAAFGKLIGGEAALDELATTATAPDDRPKEDCLIVAITVQLNEYELPEVDKLQ